MAVVISKRVTVPVLAPPVGTTWLFEENGTFKVPATGNYEIELHGGGGGAENTTGYGGGGSGQLVQSELKKGELYNISIGRGGAISASGEKTSFGELYFVNGGDYAKPYGPGSGVGNIATSGSGEDGFGLCAGGLGNSSNPNQKYGNGGSAIWSDITYGYIANKGENGAIIITYLG